MKISANWLSDYVSHDLSPEDMGDRLTMFGLEVEEIERLGGSVEGVVVGRVESVEAHPNADRLTVCTVSVDSDELLPIVCGAPNVAPGQKVPVALVGTTLTIPDRDHPGRRVSLKLKKAKIRGEVSEGMICAEDELGLSDDHSGIMVLDEDAAVGSPFASYLNDRGIDPSDAVIDIAITPNRPDAICHLGVARDVAAILEVPLSAPNPEIPDHGGEAAGVFDVRIESFEGCPRYVGILVRNVSVAASPPWMQQRLRAIGLRPRNNIVDITNYVMYELGQPLHAFDFDQLAGAQIVVHQTAGPSKFTTLDSKERDLAEGTLMIADADRDIAIAGVMGGENSEVTETTKNVLIESAYFDPIMIRKTARALQLQTDASYRFERGVDPSGQARAAARAAELMAEHAGGQIVPGMVDAHDQPFERRSVELRLSRISRVLGIDVPGERVVSLLTAIGFKVSSRDDVLDCLIPSFRPDIEREIDVIEEVARLVGYDAILEPSHSSVPNRPVRWAPTRQVREAARDALVGLGFREVVTNSMLSREMAEAFMDAQLPGGRLNGDVVETLNPVSLEMATLRPSLLPGVLRVAGHNSNRGRTSLRYFEFGNAQIRASSDRTLVEGYTEVECLLVLQAGEQEAQSWDTNRRNSDIFDLKGAVNALLSKLGLRDVAFRPQDEPGSVSSYALEVMSGPLRLGLLGCLKPDVVDGFDVAEDVFFCELDWARVTKAASSTARRAFAPFSRHPVVERDIAVTARSTRAVGDLLASIRGAGGDLLRSVRVFDLYEGDQIQAGRKSVAFTLTFGAERTLRDEEVDASVADIVSSLESECDAKLRQ